MSFRDLNSLRRHYAGQAGQLVNEFYLPVLGAATRYDRQSGYFNSSALVQIAAGLSAFIANVRRHALPGRPPMRLITGTTWSDEDIEAYHRGIDLLYESLERTALRRLEPTEAECRRLGLPIGWKPEADQIARDRLGTLSWMVASGLLEVRIALPLDHSGQPLYPGQGGGLFHPKVGILSNGDDNVIAFSGSVNETSAAWTRNREEFEVKRSWFNPLDAEDIQVAQARFEAIWNRKDPGLLVLPLPQAVREHLAAFTSPDGPPRRDPMQRVEPDQSADLRDRIAAQWLLDAPTKPGGEALVLAPIWVDGKPFEPFPHQARISQQAVDSFPRSYLFCDEVGLGKTIEAGLVLRSLILKRELGRVLIIAPRSLVRQWMEELREKFALTAWFYDGQMLHDVGGRVRRSEDPWAEEGIVIVSRHLIARQERMGSVLSARPWDAVVIDEAHAARRRVFGADEPNLLLQLLQEMRRLHLFRCLWLLTATPMQLAAHEVHDLLLLAGVDDPRWGPWADLHEFELFFDRLRSFASAKGDRAEVVTMTRRAVEIGAPDLSPDEVPAHWTGLQWRSLVQRIRSNGSGLALAMQGLLPQQAEGMTPYLARQTPLAVHMFRHTRQTLRAYRDRGLLHAGLADRRPEDVPVTFQSPAEEALYRRIDVLCSQFYRLAEVEPDERSGVGFLMAVFRKRLASSFAAFRKSLERRRDLIAAVQRDLAVMDEAAQFQRTMSEGEEDEDEAEAAAALDRERQRLLRLRADPHRRQKLEEERLYLQDYIFELHQIDKDSKFCEFAARLDDLLDRGRRVIVFTQYLDTLDFIRDQLIARYGARMACYSGRGGEVWDASTNAWHTVDKAEVKARCKQSHTRAIDILLGTDAASEGLNLQEFSALVNYDLPWNPMRVEQRIGRIDRIGQAAKVVLVSNLYLTGTIEEDTYWTLKDRIGVFEDVVGPLQPILAEMPSIFRKLAQGEIERAEALRQLEAARNRQAPAVAAAIEDLSPDLEGSGSAATADPPATQAELAYWCLQHPAPGMQIRSVPEPDTDHLAADGAVGCLSITWAYAPPHLGIGSNEELLGTFSGEVADRHPPTGPTTDATGVDHPGKEGVRLLTWGDPYLMAWLEAVRGEPVPEMDYHQAELEVGRDPLR
ncbi:SNF2-related protein [Tautonia rosea]|uniref:SNF2-related protein n=1 Tax=Tautonia rosea TaxID=2728037 RepID=UPI001473A4C3|nr:SNF2-related protein [Tautonia rosea]